jgi:hypothetical protein
MGGRLPSIGVAPDGRALRTLSLWREEGWVRAGPQAESSGGRRTRWSTRGCVCPVQSGDSDTNIEWVSGHLVLIDRAAMSRGSISVLIYWTAIASRLALTTDVIMPRYARLIAGWLCG